MLCPIHKWDDDGTERGYGVLRDDRSYCIVCGLALDGTGDIHPDYWEQIDLFGGSND